MTQPTQHTPPSEAADVDRAALIDEALSATGILPPYDRLLELNAFLDTEIQAAVQQVRRQTAGLNRGSADWYQRDCAIAHALADVSEGLGDGLRSAALHVAELGRRLRALDKFAHGDL